ncbi:MAG: imidazole glycerol phosphate synthase subunit HisH [Candidatus Omnitrophica bacterium]|nr:imidazole glycerol phosphate synthase subunit HisH [Candidatus Omnitrophota bacterium]
MIGIIDYGSGNLKSVYNAFRYLGQNVEICRVPRELERSDKIVFPGVGSSVDAMKSLNERGFIKPLLEEIEKEKPFLGICLGLQLLFEHSEEAGGCDCLGVVKGNVKLFSQKNGLKIPQIGWNTVKFRNKKCPLFEGIKDGTFFYFVHSYYCDNEQAGVSAGVTEYGIEYCSVLWKKNVFAVQFHPERSQENGLKLLENFIKI